MANGTVLAKLSFSGRHHRCFLRQARGCPQPGHHKQPRQTSRFSPPPCLPLRFHNWERGLKHLVSPALKLSAFTSAPLCQTWTLLVCTGYSPPLLLALGRKRPTAPSQASLLHQAQPEQPAVGSSLSGTGGTVSGANALRRQCG